MTSTQRLTPVALALCAALSSAQQFQDQTATRLPVQAVWSEEVDAADLDGDGDLDLVYAKGDGFASAGAPRQNTILINDGTGVFADQTATRLPALTGNAKDVDLVDVDGDGDFDLVVANGFGQQPRLFLNDG
ncbi:MAG TPA: FG-GAP-like repeat-containing protein, partial [Planctomycetota bacterium]|nr:FG-GAP-like repeat-containing protein [Planctomycetota bacterium]